MDATNLEVPTDYFVERTPYRLKEMRFTDKDLEFLIDAGMPGVSDRLRLKQILRADEDFRDTLIGDEKVFRRLMRDEEILLKISPALYFEILLRKTAQDLSRSSYTLEKTITMSIPVFDTGDLADLLSKKSLLIYLADMLSSFTRIESHTFSIRIGERTWEKIHFNDLDIKSLMRFCEAVDDDLRLGLFKRIADISLFVLGIFPDFVESNYRYPLSGNIRPQFGKNYRISPHEYEKTGRKFYKLAAEHRAAEKIELCEVFWDLHHHFQMVKKPLNFIADHYLRYRRDDLFAC